MDEWTEAMYTQPSPRLEKSQDPTAGTLLERARLFSFGDGVARALPSRDQSVLDGGEPLYVAFRTT